MIICKCIQKSVIILLLSYSAFGQVLKVHANGNETFYFKDELNRNQASFLSEASFESFRGISNDVWGYVSFDPGNIKGTLDGEISISVNSIKTGIEQRDKNLRGVAWLNSDNYPHITYKIKNVESINIVDDITVKLVTLGEFTLRGQTKLVYAKTTMKYLEESEFTKIRNAGNLLDVQTEFDIKLSDFNINHIMIGKRVSDLIKVSASIIGSTVKPQD